MLLGVDIGGSKVKIGAVSESNRRIITRIDRPFSREEPFDKFASALIDACRTIEDMAGERASAVGLCAPGYGDAKTGMLVDGGANVPALRGRPLAGIVAEQLGVPAHFENDGVAAAFCECRFGAGRSFQRVLVLILGTGVGGCVVVDGQPLKGRRGEPPELGAMILDDGGRSRGQLASLERRASTAGFLAAYREAGGTQEAADVKDLFRLAPTDAHATFAIETTARRISQAVGILTNALALDACIIGGGIAQAGEPLLELIRHNFSDFCWPLLAKGVAIASAAHGDSAGIVGAASLAGEPPD
jgi:glucokinase